MSVHITRILNKANPTGKEVGQVMLYNMAASYRQLSEAHTGSYKKKYEVVPHMEIARMKASLKSSYDIESFNDYVKICSYISKEQGFASSALQTAKLGYWKLQQMTQAALTAESTLAEYAKMPLIVTEKQYSDYVAKILGERRRKLVNLAELILEVVEELGQQFHAGENLETQAIMSFQHEFFKANQNKRIDDIGTYDFSGRYILADGSSSTDYSREEWIAVVDRLIYGDESGYQTEEEKLEARKTRPNFFTDSDLCSLEINYILEDLYKKQQPTLDISSMRSFIKWEPLEKEDKTMYGSIILYNLKKYYPALFGEREATEEEINEQKQEFRRDFPETSSIILTIIRMTIPEAEPFIDADNWQQGFISIGSLVDNKKYSFRKKLEITSMDIAEQVYTGKEKLLCKFNGIAILRDEDVGLYNLQGLYNIDDRGYYVGTNFVKNLDKNSVYSIYKNEEAIQAIQTARDTELLPALRELYAYNKILELITELTGVDVMPFALLEQVEELHRQIEALNGSSIELLNNVASNVPLFLTNEEFVRTRACREIFSQIDLSALDLEEAAVEKTRAYIQDMTVFSYNSPLIIETLKERGTANE